MKKIIIFSFIAVIGLLLGVFFSQKQTKKTNVITQASPTQSPTTSIMGISGRQPTYIPTQTFSAPSSISHYLVGENPKSEDYIPVLTKLLGFSSSPKSITGSKGAYLVWNESGKSLIIGGNPLEISYTSGKESTQKLTASTSLYETASFSFLTSLSSLFGVTKPKLVSKTYLLPTNGDPLPKEQPTDATIFLAGYSLTVDDFPLISRSASTESTSVGVDAQGNILSFHTYVFPQFSKSATPIRLISYSEAESNLLSGRGVLLAFSYNGTSKKENVIIQSNNPPQTSKIINTLMGYYFSPGQSDLVPVYLFLGEGLDAENNMVSTTTIVSASQ